MKFQFENTKNETIKLQTGIVKFESFNFKPEKMIIFEN